MNKVILIGRLTKDLELKYNPSNKAVCQFTLAVNKNFTNQNGEREADFINCVVWEKQAENLVKYCSKGSQVAIEGRIQVRSYDGQDGTKKYVTEIKVNSVEFIQPLEKKPLLTEEKIEEKTEVKKEDPFTEFEEEYELSNEDLPF